MRRVFLLSIYAALTILGSYAGAVEQWDVFELEFRSDDAPHTLKLPFAVTFAQGEPPNERADA